MSVARCDLVVIGAGPAGASAALAAAEAGLKVVLFDENAAAGGQVYRAPAWGSAAGPDGAAGDALRESLAASSVECRFGHRVWFVERGFRICAVGAEGPVECRAPTLVVATGAQERHRPIPGWTLPGVIGLAAATNLLKAQRILPGRRVLVAGSGPLLLLVAATILEAGGTVAGVVDASDRGDWLRALPELAGRPDLIARGAGWYLSLLRSGASLLHGHALRRIEGGSSVESATAAPIGGGAEIRLACDSVCYGFGLMPATDITRLLGAAHRFDCGLGGWFPQTAAGGATNLPGLFVCGDGAGILGAAAAGIRGRLAGLAAARAAGRAVAAPAPILVRQAARAARFGAAMTRLANPPDALLAAITPETIVCRCEGVRRIDLEAAMAGGAVTLSGLKSVTCCGIGPCGGRICEDGVAALIAAATGRSREEIGQGTARPPLRPVPLAAVSGAFDYAALPMPEPAPQ